MGGKPLCMVQHYQLLNACRIPGLKKDTHVHIPPTDSNQPRHITLIHNNHVGLLLQGAIDNGILYCVKALRDKNESFFTFQVFHLSWYAVGHFYSYDGSKETLLTNTIHLANGYNEEFKRSTSISGYPWFSMLFITRVVQLFLNKLNGMGCNVIFSCKLYPFQIFSVDVYGAQGKPLSVAQLRTQIQACVEQSKVPTTPLGILTTMDRSSWGKAYHEMVKGQWLRLSWVK